MSRRQKLTAKRVERFWADKYTAAAHRAARACVAFDHLKAILEDRHTDPNAPIWAVINDRLDDLLTEITATTDREVFQNKISVPGRDR